MRRTAFLRHVGLWTRDGDEVGRLVVDCLSFDWAPQVPGVRCPSLPSLARSRLATGLRLTREAVAHEESLWWLEALGGARLGTARGATSRRTQGHG